MYSHDRYVVSSNQSSLRANALRVVVFLPSRSALDLAAFALEYFKTPLAVRDIDHKSRALECRSSVRRWHTGEALDGHLYFHNPVVSTRG